MRILFEITHPKHAHLFRNAILRLKDRGSEIAIATREKDVTTRLLSSWGFEYTVLTSQPSGGILSLGRELLRRDWRLWCFAREFNPDVLVGRVGPSAAHVGFLIRRPVVIFEDTEDGTLQQKISFPFVTRIYTSQHYEKEWGAKHIRYGSFDELAYLHPKRFTPNPDVPRKHGLEPGSYILVRFVSWKAAHDTRHRGIELNDRLNLLNALEKYGRVLVSSEASLPEEYKQFRILLPPDEFHDLLAFAKMTFGESSTVATEGAMLGVFGVLINTMNWGSINRLTNQYRIVFQTQSSKDGLQIAEDLLNDPETPNIMKRRHEKLLNQQTDLTQWMIEQIEFWGSQLRG
jgi:predicted glycosyltransferase